MKRRDFLKLIGIAPVAPGVLAAIPKKQLTIKALKECAGELKKLRIDGGGTVNVPIGIAAEDIPKDEYGWMWVVS